MSMNSLPPELFANIVSLVVAKQKQLTKYATLSRAWQRAIEERTFSHLSVFSDELDEFESFVLESPYTHRRTAVRRVEFSINLPDYDDNACGRFERQADRHVNDTAFTKAMAGLFTALATINSGNGSRSIDLHLLHFYSSMDINRRDEEKLRADKLARATGNRHDLFDLRYRDSYLQLLDLESLPLLHNVTSLTVHGDTARKLAPAVAGGLMSRLPNVAAIDCSFWDGERRRPDQRRQLRSELAKQLISLAAPKSLQKLTLNLNNREPGNSNFVDADVRGSLYTSHADDLSTELRLFLQAAPCLTEFNLTGPISISADLFRSLEDAESGNKQRWQKLEECIIELSAVRPDGGWYTEIDHERDPETSGDEDEEEEEDEDMDSSSDIVQDDARSEGSSSGYDSSDSFFAMDQLPPDSYGYGEEKRDARFNGDEPSTSSFRTRPTQELEVLFLAAACAVPLMPRLKYMNVGHKIRPSERTGGQFQELGFEYLAKGVEYPGDGADAMQFSRLYWSVCRGWRMSQELESQWRLLLGDDAIVEYNEW
ncbi:unnamed protein product [Aureobasidium vineae]|uniref:F-box domain-containing protein n=1 Tax=Aureobasidium vineae TaxID=2773715 RepID=A0A9N8JE08_9PEZI|nr:unnamed protein product [Aureobasidium vineae]